MSVQGFWGLQLVPGKTYSQVVAAPFRISMASLTVDADGNKRTSVSVLIDNKEFVLCTLVPNKIEQQPLDITFVEGEEVTFSAKGSNAVHLTGNYVFHDDDEGDMGSMGDESEEEDNVEEFLKKLPPNATKEDINKALIASINGGMDESDEEIDSDEAMGEDDSESEDDDDYEEEEKPAVNKKRPAEDTKTPPTKKQKAAEQAKKPETKKLEAKKEEPKKEQAKKKEEPKKKEEQKKEQAKKEEQKKEQAKKKEEQKKEEPKKKVTKLPNGLIIEDIKVGEGASCKSGQRVGMRYIGKLTNGKVFDKNVSGKPFSFLLGRGEVIKGWDLGIVGMKAGGERRLTIPAPLAYGKRGAPPDIPKNATLVFDVKLLTMK